MKNKILWSLFVFGLIASFVLLFQRIDLDNKKDYYFTSDFVSLINLHKGMGLPNEDLDDTLSKLKEHNIHTITLSNNNLYSLEERGLVDVYSGSELFGRTNNSKFKNEYTYIHIYNEDQEIFDILEERFDDYSFDIILDGDINYVGINISLNKLIYLSLPFLSSDVDFITTLGFNIVFKIDNKFEDKIDLVINNVNSYIEKYSNLNFAIEFTENGYLSYDYEEELDLNELPSTLYLYREFFADSERQKGFGSVAKEHNFARMHFISNTVFLNNYKDMGVISDRVILAVSERNIKFVSFQVPNITDNMHTKEIFNEFLSMVDDINSNLSTKGYSTSNSFNKDFSFADENLLNKILVSLSYLAAISFICIVVTKFFNLHNLITSSIIFSVVLISFFNGNILTALILKVVVLLYVCLIPFFIFYLLFNKLSSIKSMNIFKSIGLYLLLNFFVVLFALLISSLHFSELYFKYIYAFSGISLATTVPLFLIILTVFFVKDNKFYFSSVLNFLKRPILIYQVIVCGIVLFGLLFYISRSGNSGVLLPFEKELRTLMTDLFSVRPRTKEFLLAQPILITSIYFFNKNYFSRFLLPVAAIAQISIINTFCHLHTPIIVNILRASFGTLIGLVLGLILICIILLLIWLFKKLKKHKS